MGVGLIGGGGGLQSDDLTATAANVLSGLTYIGADTDDEIGTGTMTNNHAVDETLNAGGSYTIPAGYHDGNGKVRGRALSEETQGTATAAQILVTRTAWVAGQQRTGTMPNNGAQTATIDIGSPYTIPAGYHNGSGVVTAKGLDTKTSGTATAGQVLSGKTCWVNGNPITGTMPVITPVQISKNAGEQYSIPAGYHDGTEYVTARGLDAETPGTANAERIRAPYTAWVGGQLITGTARSIAARTITPTTSNTVVAGDGFLTGNISMVGSQYLKPEYIKKNVTIFGVTGTWEGLT